ncbi:MAG: DUF763 domain-containing protein [candidate division WOR-3 bacterium]
MRKGFATLPLHWGKVPKWLFEDMKKLSLAIIEVMLMEYPQIKILENLSDPFWFQALGCVLGFDWHSSGLTTTVMGALKEAFNQLDAGIYVCGGKGKTSLKTPEEIKQIGFRKGINIDSLIYASKMTAKIDNSALQDGYSIYHHTIIFSSKGEWSVVQQGMNLENRTARRYHWFSGSLKDYTCEPHKGIITDSFTTPLNMVSKDSIGAREISTKIASEYPEKTIKELKKIRELKLPPRHEIIKSDINLDRLKKTLELTFNRQPENFEILLGIKGVGPATIRALALISELLYGEHPSFEDPARYSFAHGGKDGIPYPIDRENYKNSILFLKKAISMAKLGDREKLNLLKRLAFIENENIIKK